MVIQECKLNFFRFQGSKLLRESLLRKRYFKWCWGQELWVPQLSSLERNQAGISNGVGGKNYGYPNLVH